MITELTDLPKGVIGFSATGRITGQDYKEVFIPSMEAALAGGGKLRLLFYAGPEFEGYGASGMWDDSFFGMRHYFDFEKIAFVTDNQTYGSVTHGLGFLIPAAVRVFKTADVEAAKAWLAAPE